MKIRRILQDIDEVTRAVCPGKEMVVGETKKPEDETKEKPVENEETIWNAIAKMCIKALEFIGKVL